MANKFVIEVKAKGFGNLNNQLKRSDDAMKNYGNNSQRAGRQTNEFRKQIALVRNNILLYTFALTGAARVFNSFISKASDARETLSQFRVVFGDQADAAMDFANTLTKSFGQSQADVVALMASLQDTFVPLGFSREEASKLSGALTQLSFDVASFKNASSPEVSQAFTSAIVGNHEAVRKFGIVITEARVKQKAMEMGLWDGTGAASAQAKVLARTNLIIEGSKDAIGDFARTQHEFANQVRILGNTYKDLAIDVGNALIPVAKLAMHFASTTHIKAYVAALGLIGLGYTLVQRKAIMATIATQKFRIGLIKSAVGIGVIAFGELIARMMGASKETEKLQGELMDLENALEGIGSDDDKNGVGFLKILEQHLGTTLIEAHRVHDGINHAAEALEKWNNHRKDFEETQAMWDAEQAHLDFVAQMMEGQEDKLMSEADLIKFRAAIQSAAFRREQQEIQQKAYAFRQFSDQLGRAVAEGQALGPAVVNSLKAIVAELTAQAASLMLLNMFIPGGVTAGKAGFTLLDAIFGHSGGAITSKGIQRFARGGMVGGGDNVPIIAQAGEFIMRRDAVQSIGLDQLHRMNQTGQSNSVTVNISAPMVDETVVDHIIPAIEKTQRFNLA